MEESGDQFKKKKSPLLDYYFLVGNRVGKDEKGVQQQPSHIHSSVICYGYNLFRWYPYKLSKRRLCTLSPSSSMVAEGVLGHFSLETQAYTASWPTVNCL